MHDDVKEKVAKFLLKVGVIRPLDGVDDLIAFLDEMAAKAGMRLLAIPRAAIRRAEAGDDFAEAGDAL
jgi:hypothetical protein